MKVDPRVCLLCLVVSSASQPAAMVRLLGPRSLSSFRRGLPLNCSAQKKVLPTLFYPWESPLFCFFNWKHERETCERTRGKEERGSAATRFSFLVDDARSGGTHAVPETRGWCHVDPVSRTKRTLCTPIHREALGLARKHSDKLGRVARTTTYSTSRHPKHFFYFSQSIASINTFIEVYTGCTIKPLVTLRPPGCVLNKRRTVRQTSIEC